jgi:alkylation response protein AidB-like acyl-CoA dehydrogenase
MPSGWRAITLHTVRLSSCVLRSGAANDGEASTWVNAFLANRCLTIAGGTSEVQRNVIAERLLGLPRD